MARRIDQIEVVDLPIERLVMQRCGLCLDSYPTLFFDVHRVKNLCLHLTLGEAATTLDQAVCKGRLAVINVRND